MNLKNKTYEEICSLYKELLAESKILDRKLTAVYNKKTAFEVDKDNLFAKDIPEELTKITSAQWSWLLTHNHYTTTTHYEIAAKYIEKLGFHNGGFWEDTNQVALVISRYGFSKRKKIIANGFQIVNPHLKAKTHNGTNMGKNVPETGTCYEVHSWKDSNERPILYARTTLKPKQKPFALYISNWTPPKEFNSFNEFLDFYETVVQED